MATPVTMPVLGLTMEEGTVARWLKREGEAVAKDEPLLTVEMDKGTVEVASPAAGVLLRIVVAEGKTVPVKTLIAELGQPGEAPDQAKPPAPPTEAAPDAVSHVQRTAIAEGGTTGARSAAPTSTGAAEPDAVSHAHRTAVAVGASEAAGAPRDITRRFSSPRARLRARELGLDVRRIAGSGPLGRVVEADVVAFTTAAQAAPAAAGRVLPTPLARRLALEPGVDLAAVQGSGPGGRVTNEDVLAAAERRRVEAESGSPSVAARAAAAAGPSRAHDTPEGEAIHPLSRPRRITAERMALSARSVPRVTLHLEADLTDAAAFRKQLQPEFARLGVPKLPWDALVAKAAGLALAEHPAVNAEWVEGQGIRRYPHAHVGVAVALAPEGLVVPVLREADTRGLRALAGDLLTLMEKARGGRLGLAEMEGGTFSLTNLGAYRVDGFTPILNPPQAAILGVGRIAEKPAVVSGQLIARTLCTLSLAFDHRVVDGAPAAAFLARLAELLERPYALLGI